STHRPPPRPPLFPYPTPFRSRTVPLLREAWEVVQVSAAALISFTLLLYALRLDERMLPQDRVSRTWLLLFGFLAGLLVLVEPQGDRKSTRLNSSHVAISYAVF